TPSSLIDNVELVEDMARYSEGLVTQAQVKKKWRKLIDEKTWEALGSNDELVEKIELEKVRRIRNGQAKREKSQQLIVKACEILDDIAQDTKASPRHRVDAIKTLDAFADNGPKAAPDTSEKFSIVINLGEDYRLRVGPNGSEVIDNTL